MHEIKIPSVGESITSAMITRWQKQDGDVVKANDVVVSFDTDKVSEDLEAGADGVLRIVAGVGEEVAIGTVIGTVESDDGAAAAASESAESETPAESEPEETPAEEAPEIRATPAATRIAEKKGVDLSTVTGTGTGGKITKKDVLAAIEAKKSAKEPEDEPETEAADSAIDGDTDADAEPEPEPELSVVPSPSAPEEVAPDSESGEKRTTRKKMSPLRRKIAAQLVGAQQEAAILTTFNECDMSAVMSLRKRVQDSFVEKYGVKLGFMSFFIKAVVEALQSVPRINSRIDGDEVIENHFYDIGVAVGTDKGLIVPVVRDCESKTFAEIEQAIGDYAGRAREGKIQLEDIQGGVFTISNGGIYGSLLSTPILNPPQSGILGMHAIQQRPVAIDSEVVIRPMMNLALSYDHRVVDGKEAVTFLVRVKECIESPERLLVGA